MKVQLSLYARNLPNVAGIFKGTSDPYAVVTLMNTEESEEEKPVVLGKTEVIKNTLNPNWAKMFIFDFELGKLMHVAVGVYDEIRKDDNKSMGSTIIEIGAVLGSKGNIKAKKMKGGGTLYARVERNVGSGSLKLQMRGVRLKNTEGIFRKSDPFFELERRDKGPRGFTWNNVYRSKFIPNNLDPIWEEATVDLSTLCNGDFDRPIRVVVYDHEKSGDHVLMGSFETTVNGLILDDDKKGGENNRVYTVNSFTLMRKGKDRGEIIIFHAEVTTRPPDDLMQQGMSTDSALSVEPEATVVPPVTAYVPTEISESVEPNFVDYISGGCELNLCIAIDFTGSNGDPRVPGTLHYYSDMSKNDYEKVIHSLGTILANYDSSQSYPVWGFGAKFEGVVRHCFQCGPTVKVSGINGIMNAYHSVFKSGITMSRPTVFTEVIQLAANHASSAQEIASQRGEQAYTILLILTDGNVSNVNATATALDKASESPLSVIIVGIGRANFNKMELLVNRETNIKRRIANFVEYNAHSHSAQSFTEAALNKLPDQLVRYFFDRGIMPLSPVQTNEEEIVVEPYKVDEDIEFSLEFFEDGEIVFMGETYEVQTLRGF